MACGFQNKMRHVQQVATVMLQNAIQLEIAVKRELVGVSWNSGEVWRQGLDVAQFSGNAEQEVFGALVEARQSADGVAGVGAYAELIDPPNVDGDAHKFSVNREGVMLL